MWAVGRKLFIGRSKKGKRRMKKISFNGSSQDLLKLLKRLIKEGQTKRIIIKNKDEKILLNIPLTVGVCALLYTPLFFGVSIGAACATGCVVEIEAVSEK
ncbi:hypothetical protein DID78_03880 [Candidatus Marinamargulisbacteria bacterium SCGC AG-343-D04]|nr:hypothetical protein DID78_03880 [Candidatus Marinamargulisbacteria bacterium SCGC AG-343-D04]